MRVVERLVDLCLAVVVKNINLVPTLETLPDEVLQKLISVMRRERAFGPHTLQLFANSKMSKLDLRHQEGVEVDDQWLEITKGGIRDYLQSLDLSGATGITDACVDGIARLHQLNNLNISGCEGFTGDPLHISKLFHLPLQRLVLDGCTSLLVEPFLTHLVNFPHLASLDIANCSLTDNNIKPIQHLTTLTFLDISQNTELTGNALHFISNLYQLKELLMTRCSLISHGLRHLRGLTNLTTLSLAHCEVGDSAIQHVEPLTQLESLSLINASISDSGMLSVGRLTGLTSLDLSMCGKVSDIGMKALHQLQKIKNLNLNFCSVTDAGVAALTGVLRQLTSLELIGCKRLLIHAAHRPLVLLAEDNPFQSNVIKRTLERLKFDVDIASNGQIALDMYRANRNYELIVMDIMMPEMDGLTSTMRIRQFEREYGLKRTPIIMQTADAGVSHKQTCLDAGCDAMMNKPIAASTIEDIASKLIGERHSHNS